MTTIKNKKQTPNQIRDQILKEIEEKFNNIDNGNGELYETISSLANLTENQQITKEDLQTIIKSKIDKIEQNNSTLSYVMIFNKKFKFNKNFILDLFEDFYSKTKNHTSKNKIFFNILKGIITLNLDIDFSTKEIKYVFEKIISTNKNGNQKLLSEIIPILTVYNKKNNLGINEKYIINLLDELKNNKDQTYFLSTISELQPLIVDYQKNQHPIKTRELFMYIIKNTNLYKKILYKKLEKTNNSTSTIIDITELINPFTKHINDILDQIPLTIDDLNYIKNIIKESPIKEEFIKKTDPFVLHHKINNDIINKKTKKTIKL